MITLWHKTKGDADYLTHEGEPGEHIQESGRRTGNTRGRARDLTWEGELPFQNKTGNDETKTQDKTDLTAVWQPPSIHPSIHLSISPSYATSPGAGSWGLNRETQISQVKDIVSAVCPRSSLNNPPDELRPLSHQICSFSLHLRWLHCRHQGHMINTCASVAQNCSQMWAESH